MEDREPIALWLRPQFFTLIYQGSNPTDVKVNMIDVMMFCDSLKYCVSYGR